MVEDSRDREVRQRDQMKEKRASDHDMIDLVILRQGKHEVSTSKTLDFKVGI